MSEGVTDAMADCSLLGSLMDSRFVGCNNEVKSIPNAAFGKLISNAGRSTGGDGKWSG
jgi:hypothetical protein